MSGDDKKVLDPCCGSKMFWFDKDNPIVLYCDIREIENEVIWRSKDGNSVRTVSVKPDVVANFTNLPFEDESFYHVVFDPPHLVNLGETAWLCKKYGRLEKDTWERVIHDGFWECWRVLKPNGTLIFKWSEIDITVREVLKAIGMQPLYGHKSGKHKSTHWMAFFKEEER